MEKKLGKEKWIAMFKEIGLTDEQMVAWHRIFEKRHPDSHQGFLMWLGIPENDIDKIRANSR
jgi:hypothetical protein